MNYLRLTFFHVFVATLCLRKVRKASFLIFLKDFIYLFEGKGRERERERIIGGRDISWLPLTRPQLGTWPTTRAHALTRN